MEPAVAAIDLVKAVGIIASMVESYLAAAVPPSDAKGQIMDARRKSRTRNTCHGWPASTSGNQRRPRFASIRRAPNASTIWRAKRSRSDGARSAGVATAAMLGISMRLNFLFGCSLGQTPEKAWVFGFVSVVSDAWKSLGPIFILALIRTQRWPSAASAASIWIVCFIYSVSSARGRGRRRSLHAHRQPREFSR